MQEHEPNVEAELRTIADALVREYRPEKIILFGSYAWGTPHKDSDADLCVLKEHSDDPLEEMTRAYSIAADARKTLPLDVIVYRPSRFAERARMGDPFVKRILSHGKVLYDAGRG